VRSEVSEARTYLQHYYLYRLVSVDFWKRLASGKINVSESIGSLFSFIGKVFNGRDQSGATPEAGGEFGGSFIDQMLAGLEAFSGRVLLITSGGDLTAAEFNDLVCRSRRWQSALSAGRTTRKEIAGANHTFSRRIWRDQVAEWCRDWVGSW